MGTVIKIKWERAFITCPHSSSTSYYFMFFIFFYNFSLICRYPSLLISALGDFMVALFYFGFLLVKSIAASPTKETPPSAAQRAILLSSPVFGLR